MDITNLALKDFLKQDIEVIQDTMSVLNYIKPTETTRQLFDLSLRDVQDTKDNLASGTFEELIKCVYTIEAISPKAVLNMKIVDFWGKVMSIKEQVSKINHMEQVSLTSNHTNFKWEAVEGGKRMAKFGIYNTLDTLSGGDILKYEAILNLPYADVFTKLYMNRMKSDLEQEMANLKTQK